MRSEEWWKAVELSPAKRAEFVYNDGWQRDTHGRIMEMAAAILSRRREVFDQDYDQAMDEAERLYVRVCRRAERAREG